MRKLLVMVAAIVVAVVPVPIANAIIGGELDGDRHPFVGAVDVRPTGKTIPASGVLISPTVFLTAGHVTHFFDEKGLNTARVTFASDYNDTNATFYTGTVHTHPQFGGSGVNDTYDIAVIVFDSPIPGISPAKLPTLEQLDALGPQGLRAEGYPVVGYGISNLLGGANGGGAPQPDRASAGVRKTGEWSFRSLTADWLRFDMGDAQACTGDSGAPNFLGDTNVVVGIGIGGDANCRSMGADLRLDTQRVRDFLGQYVTVP